MDAIKAAEIAFLKTKAKVSKDGKERLVLNSSDWRKLRARHHWTYDIHLFEPCNILLRKINDIGQQIEFVRQQKDKAVIKAVTKTK